MKYLDTRDTQEGIPKDALPFSKHGPTGERSPVRLPSRLRPLRRGPINFKSYLINSLPAFLLSICMQAEGTEAGKLRDSAHKKTPRYSIFDSALYGSLKIK
jgi:hypothetical protein